MRYKYVEQKVNVSGKEQTFPMLVDLVGNQKIVGVEPINTVIANLEKSSIISSDVNIEQIVQNVQGLNELRVLVQSFDPIGFREPLEKLAGLDEFLIGLLAYKEAIDREK